MDRSLSLKAAEKPVALETGYYLKTIGSIRSIDDFLKDTRIFRFAMTAFGLEDMAHAKGFIRKVLSEGVADPKAFARRLADDRFVELATVFNFAGNGEQTTSSAAAQQGVVDRYIRQRLEVSAGEENEGVRLALYFQRAAPEVTSAFSLLADPALWKVVKTIFGFPDEMASADIDKQAAAVLRRLDIADLKDPEKLNRMIQRFAAVWDATEVTAADPILSLFNSSDQAVGLELLLTLRNLKHGGV
jgi:hypothetical protein